jgi:hypothetical protein
MTLSSIEAEAGVISLDQTVFWMILMSGLVRRGLVTIRRKSSLLGRFDFCHKMYIHHLCLSQNPRCLKQRVAQSKGEDIAWRQRYQVLSCF